jgi:hypothetical protein
VTLYLHCLYIPSRCGHGESSLFLMRHVYRRSANANNEPTNDSGQIKWNSDVHRGQPLDPVRSQMIPTSHCFNCFSFIYVQAVKVVISFWVFFFAQILYAVALRVPYFILHVRLMLLISLLMMRTYYPFYHHTVCCLRLCFSLLSRYFYIVFSDPVTRSGRTIVRSAPKEWG